MNDSLIQEKEYNSNDAEGEDLEGISTLCTVTSQTKKRKPLKRAPTAPKRFKSAYIYFVMDKMEEVKKIFSEDVKVTEVMKRLAYMWRILPPLEKKEYEEIAAVDKSRYFNEMSIYSGPIQVPNRRQKKPVDAPKRGISAFLSFSQLMRPKIRAEHPEIRNTDISTVLAEKWRQASDEEKQPHLTRELRERKKYHVNMLKWKQKSEALQQGQEFDESSMDTITEPTHTSDRVGILDFLDIQESSMWELAQDNNNIEINNTQDEPTDSNRSIKNETTQNPAILEDFFRNINNPGTESMDFDGDYHMSDVESDEKDFGLIENYLSGDEAVGVKKSNKIIQRKSENKSRNDHTKYIKLIEQQLKEQIGKYQQRSHTERGNTKRSKNNTSPELHRDVNQSSNAKTVQRHDEGEMKKSLDNNKTAIKIDPMSMPSKEEVFSGKPGQKNLITAKEQAAVDSIWTDSVHSGLTAYVSYMDKKEIDDTLTDSSKAPANRKQPSKNTRNDTKEIPKRGTKSQEKKAPNEMKSQGGSTPSDNNLLKNIKKEFSSQSSEESPSQMPLNYSNSYDSHPSISQISFNQTTSSSSLPFSQINDASKNKQSQSRAIYGHVEPTDSSIFKPVFLNSLSQFYVPTAAHPTTTTAAATTMRHSRSMESNHERSSSQDQFSIASLTQNLLNPLSKHYHTLDNMYQNNKPKANKPSVTTEDGTGFDLQNDINRLQDEQRQRWQDLQSNRKDHSVHPTNPSLHFVMHQQSVVEPLNQSNESSGSSAGQSCSTATNNTQDGYNGSALKLIPLMDLSKMNAPLSEKHLSSRLINNCYDRNRLHHHMVQNHTNTQTNTQTELPKADLVNPPSSSPAPALKNKYNMLPPSVQATTDYQQRNKESEMISERLESNLSDHSNSDDWLPSGCLTYNHLSLSSAKITKNLTDLIFQQSQYSKKTSNDTTPLNQSDLIFISKFQSQFSDQSGSGALQSNRHDKSPGGIFNPYPSIQECYYASYSNKTDSSVHGRTK